MMPHAFLLMCVICAVPLSFASDSADFCDIVDGDNLLLWTTAGKIPVKFRARLAFVRLPRVGDRAMLMDAPSWKDAQEATGKLFLDAKPVELIPLNESGATELRYDSTGALLAIVRLKLPIQLQSEGSQGEAHTEFEQKIVQEFLIEQGFTAYFKGRDGKAPAQYDALFSSAEQRARRELRGFWKTNFKWMDLMSSVGPPDSP